MFLKCLSKTLPQFCSLSCTPLRSGPPLWGWGSLGGRDSLESGGRQSPPAPPAASSPNWLSLRGAGQPDAPCRRTLSHLVTRPQPSQPRQANTHILLCLLALGVQVRGYPVQPCQCPIPLLHLLDKQGTPQSITA